MHLQDLFPKSFTLGVERVAAKIGAEATHVIGLRECMPVCRLDPVRPPIGAASESVYYDQ